MEGVRIIDADSHIEEPVEMWDHLDSVGRFSAYSRRAHSEKPASAPWISCGNVPISRKR